VERTRATLTLVFWPDVVFCATATSGAGASMRRFHRGFPLLGAFAVLASTLWAGLTSPASASDCKYELTVSDLGDNGGTHQLRSTLAEACPGATIKLLPGTITLRQVSWLSPKT
jgi:hypothetical protein